MRSNPLKLQTDGSIRQQGNAYLRIYFLLFCLSKPESLPYAGKDQHRFQYREATANTNVAPKTEGNKTMPRPGVEKSTGPEDSCVMPGSLISLDAINKSTAPYLTLPEW